MSEPSDIHPAQKEAESDQESVPLVKETIPNLYFGHLIHADFTEKHGVLYSVYGQAFPGLGQAIGWCQQNASIAPPIPFQKQILDYCADKAHLKINWTPHPSILNPPPAPQPIAPPPETTAAQTSSTEQVVIAPQAEAESAQPTDKP